MSFQVMLQQLTTGFGSTLVIFFLTLLFSLPLGMVVYFGRVSRFKPLSWIVKAYISIMRGTPLMLQLLLWYFGPFYLWGMNIGGYKFTAIILGCSLNYAAYFAEIYRSGIESIPVGQYEAAQLLGYNKSQTFFKIVLPQVVKIVLPSVTNEVITLVKDTSLVYSVSYIEMFALAKQIAAAQTTVLPFVIAGVFYYVFNFVVAWVMGWLEKQNKGSFVGNVNDGTIGLTSMDLVRDGLYAKKTWIFTPDYVLCLGAGIRSDSSYQVNTSVEQAVLRDDLLYWNKGKWEAVKDLKFSCGDSQRFFHHQTGYILLEGEGRIFSEQRTNSWNDIMKIYPKSELQTKDVFTIYMNHGILPKNDSYQYVILPATTPKEVQHFDLSSFKIISNTSQCQAVQLNKETYLLALYEAGSVPLSGELKFESNKKGLFILRTYKKKWKVYASDPTQTETSMEVILNGNKREIKLPEGEYKGTVAMFSE